jgi:dihydroorotate dehydrogenase electron transfer subunit
MVDCTARVIEQHRLSADYLLLRLEAPEVTATARPGQFVHVRVTGLGDAALRRPFSIYGADRGVLALVYKTVGRGTEHLARLTTGDAVSVIGPLGNGFPLDCGERGPLLVAGGYGVAPLSFLARRLGRRGLLLVGARRADDILCVGDFEDLGWDVRVATQDGSRGERGLVTDLLDACLAAAQAAPPVIYACGPDGMLRAVGERAVTSGARAWLSLDKHMVCGVGACLACVQRLRRADGTEWIGRVCHDGPVFEAREIVW